jgi:hypothetical protein
MPATHRGRTDAFLELLASAPDDDEPTTAEEDRSVRQVWDEYRRERAARAAASRTLLSVC